MKFALCSREISVQFENVKNIEELRKTNLANISQSISSKVLFIFVEISRPLFALLLHSTKIQLQRFKRFNFVEWSKSSVFETRLIHQSFKFTSVRGSIGLKSNFLLFCCEGTTRILVDWKELLLFIVAIGGITV